MDRPANNFMSILFCYNVLPKLLSAINLIPKCNFELEAEKINMGTKRKVDDDQSLSKKRKRN